ncbi:hypothetical protein KY290_021728 [Solanum tuberosum]|uniref:Uncharacterized protein n=1 Tax=Solanum tuberosum TaxID=4113 RepID=A0ABQ7V2D9_SOLTU|nr:hypothetical protein KY289_020891 [Solanum tuberosum]KAH0758235.1 hypothetical protein KY290_021728 [Solanum tuberosum]
MSSCFHTKIVGMNSIVSECQFHIEIKAQNFAEEERNGDARVSLLLLSSLMGFAGDYLAFAGVGCSPLACQSSCSCCLLLSSSLEQRRREKVARRSELVLALLLAGAAFACWREERIGGGARLPAGFRGCSLAGAVRCFA